MINWRKEVHLPYHYPDDRVSRSRLAIEDTRELLKWVDGLLSDGAVITHRHWPALPTEGRGTVEVMALRLSAARGGLAP